MGLGWYTRVTMCDADERRERQRRGRRRRLLEGRQAKAQDAYDQAVFKLSGGALGLSFVFVRQIAGENPRMVWALEWAWGLWIVSLVCVLWSHYSSERAMDRAIGQVDAGCESDGGWWDTATGALNAVGGFAFVVGAILAGVFMSTNLGGD